MINTELKNAAGNVLAQLKEIIVHIHERDLKKPAINLNMATVGQHIRHTLEFFNCLFDGYMLGIVNYDKRAHNKELEESKILAINTLEKINTFINQMDKNYKFLLEVDYGVDKVTVTSIETNFNRELAYNIEHAIHHMAIIKIGLNEVCPYLNIPEGFGVANSTLKYKKKIHQSHKS